MALFGNTPGSAANTESLDEQFGKIYARLLNPTTRSKAYAELDKIYMQYPEAAIVLGQYFQQNDQKRAQMYFKVAADAGIAEGQWGFANTFPHSHVPDMNNANDKTWVTYSLAAAEGGCADAANEMGNICNRKGCYAESMYWYGMAYALDHPSGMAGMQGITQKWMQNGSPKEYRAFTENYTENRHKTALLLFRMFESFDKELVDELMALVLGGENLAGFILGKLFEQGNNDEMAYTVYNATAFENHPHALRCYADLLGQGKGCEKDIPAAMRIYRQAAEKGEPSAMFMMGEAARGEKNMPLAAAWYGKAYSRGMEAAGVRLSQMIKN